MDRPLLPLPRVGLQRRRLRVGMISLSHVCPSTLRWRWSSTTLMCHAWSPVTMSKIGLLQSPESISITATNRIQLTAEHYIAVLPWLHMCTLQSTQTCSKTNQVIAQNAVNKQISKGRKTNPNSNVLFEVQIFELRLTSLVWSVVTPCN